MSGTFEPFRTRAFRNFWLASILSNTGTWMQLVTVPYCVDQLTHSTAWVGVSAFCTTFPIALLSPLAGAWTDRYPRRRVFLASQAVLVLATTALLVLWSSGRATPLAMMVCVVVSAVGNAFFNVSNTPFASEIVPPEHLVGAIRLSLTQTFCARATGPAAAAAVLTTFGPSTAFLVNVLSFLPLAIIVATATTRPSSHRQPGRAWAQFREGFSYAHARREVWISLVLVSGLGLLGVSMIQLLEPLVRHVHHRGTGDYGALVTMYGCGAVIASLWTLRLGDRAVRSRMAFVGLLATSVSVVALALGSYQVTLVAAFGLGLASIVAMMSLITAGHVNTSDDHRGRLTALVNVMFNGAMPLGALAAGLLGDAFGLRPVLLAAGLLGIVLLLALRRPYDGLRPLDDSKELSSLPPTTLAPEPT